MIKSLHEWRAAMADYSRVVVDVDESRIVTDCSRDYKICVIGVFNQEITGMDYMKITAVKNIAHWSKSGTLYYTCINR